MGRQRVVIYPDNPSSAQNIDDDACQEIDNTTACTDSVRMIYDLAGRMTARRDQRGVKTTFDYEDRGLLEKKSTTIVIQGVEQTLEDSFGYNSTGRVVLAQRGTPQDADAIAKSVLGRNAFGDLTSDTQFQGGGATGRTVENVPDQAGNRKQVTLSGGETLTNVINGLNQIVEMTLRADETDLIKSVYDYARNLVISREVTTDNLVSDTKYRLEFGYDPLSRPDRMDNKLIQGEGDPETIAGYQYALDPNANPLSQTAEGRQAFAADDRTFTVDNLDRLTDTLYNSNGDEHSVFDLLGNRESHDHRPDVSLSNYDAVNPANEFPRINGLEVAYDAAGNLITDEAGRKYRYDEQSRLIEILDDGDILMAQYVYDAFGRRIRATYFDDPQNPTVRRFVHDGATAIEEFDDEGNRTAFHVNGPLYIDERIASFDDTSDEFTYYLLNRNFSVIGTGDSTGTAIEQLDYSSTGELAGAASGPSVAHDHDGDGDVDSLDAADFVDCFGSESERCKRFHDFDEDLVSNQTIDGDDMQGLIGCLKGPGVTGEELDGCRVSASGPTLPPSGTFAMHGRPVEVLRDGKVLYFNRARFYDPEHGRWLGRDPSGYVDSENLYEAFRSNSTRFTDPSGRVPETRYASEGIKWKNDQGRATITVYNDGGYWGLRSDYLAFDIPVIADYTDGEGSVRNRAWVRMGGNEFLVDISQFQQWVKSGLDDDLRRYGSGNPSYEFVMTRVAESFARHFGGTLFGGRVAGSNTDYLPGLDPYQSELIVQNTTLIAGGLNQAQAMIREGMIQNMTGFLTAAGAAVVGGSVQFAQGARGTRYVAGTRGGAGVVHESNVPVSGPQFKTWNQFQAGTKGQFATRAEAKTAWNAYKQANDIITGVTRSMSARSQFLKSLANDYRMPSWTKPWLEKGEVPPGYQVDHITPLSIGGADTPANMFLRGADLHNIHHKFYRPWE